MYRSGDSIGPYNLVRKIGRGNFGIVWLAEKRGQIATTQFALKLPLDDEVDLEAIKQEAALWSHVSGHPNILPIIEADIYDEQIVIASEYAPDGSLADWLKKHNGKAPTLEAAVEMAAGILAGLEHLHSKEITHRDLKPKNILLQGQTPRLADFGLARLLKASAQSNIIAGTPAYMAPEAFKGVRSEHTDLWAAAIIFYEMLVGRLPYTQQDTETLAWAIINSEPEPLPLSIPQPIREALSRALQKEPASRYKSAAEMRAAFKEASLRMEQATILAPVVENGSAAAVDESAESEVTRRVARSAPLEAVKQLMAEGALAFNLGHYAVAVEKWEGVMRLSPNEPGLIDSLEAARQKLREVQQGSIAAQPQTQGAATSPLPYSGGTPGAQMQPAYGTQTQWGTQRSQQAYYDSAQRILQSGQQAKKPRWLRRFIIAFLIVIAAGGAAAAIFYFRIFDSKTSVVVSKDDQGDYKSISEALKEIKPNARLLIRAGTYNESIVIDKPVEIVADAGSNPVIIESAGAPCIVMKAEQATVRGLTLRAKGGTKGGKQPAIDIPQGRLTVENCNVTSDSFVAIAIHGAATNPTIRATAIHDARGAGLSFYDKAQGAVESCDIYANNGAGIEIKDGANPTVRATKIHGGKASGVAVTAKGKGAIEECDIYENSGPDVAIQSGGNPTISKGKIHNGKSSGVAISDGGMGMLEGVEIFASDEANVEISGAVNPLLRECRIHDGGSVGVHIEENSQGLLERCSIYANKAEGIKVESSYPTIRGCNVYDNAGAGIAFENAQGAVEGGEIYGNAGAGVEIQESGPALRNCVIRNGRSDGVRCNNARGTIEDCEIISNSGAGVRINSISSPQIKTSRIKQNRSYGVWSVFDVQQNFTGCDVADNLPGNWAYEEAGGLLRPLP